MSSSSTSWTNCIASGVSPPNVATLPITLTASRWSGARRVPGGGELPCEGHLLATVARRAEEREEQPVRPSSGGIVFDALFDGVHQVGEPFGDAAEQLRRELGEDLPHERVRVAGHHVDKAIDGGLQFAVSLQPFEPEPSDRLEHAVPVGRPLTDRQDEHAGVDELRDHLNQMELERRLVDRLHDDVHIELLTEPRAHDQVGDPPVVRYTPADMREFSMARASFDTSGSRHRRRTCRGADCGLRRKKSSSTARSSATGMPAPRRAGAARSARR